MKDKQIYSLIDRFENSSLSSIEIQQSDFRIKMEKGVGRPSEVKNTPEVSEPLKTSENEDDHESFEQEYVKVKAPIVGAFYAAPSPEEPPFVEIGEEVEAEQVLCLVEAMKMMNELKSPIHGIIRRIHGKDGELLEYDQVVFEVEPC